MPTYLVVYLLIGVAFAFVTLGMLYEQSKEKFTPKNYTRLVIFFLVYALFWVPVILFAAGRFLADDSKWGRHEGN